jgi:hypothetical protein
MITIRSDQTEQLRKLAAVSQELAASKVHDEVRSALLQFSARCTGKAQMMDALLNSR